MAGLDDMFSSGSLPYWMAGLGALGGLAGGFGNRSGTSTTGGTSASETSQTQTGSELTSQLNELTPQQQTAQNLFLGKLIDQAGGGFNDVLGAYRKAGLDQIQKSYDSKNLMLKNLMAARGLSSSPAAITPQLGLDSKRLEDISALNTSLPLMKQQMQNSALDQLIKGFASTPINKSTLTNRAAGSTMSSTGQTTGTQTTPGNVVGGVLSGIGGILAPILGQIIQKKIGGGNTGNPGAVPQTDPNGGVGGGLGNLYGLNLGNLTGIPQVPTGIMTPPTFGNLGTGNPNPNVTSTINWGDLFPGIGPTAPTTPDNPDYSAQYSWPYTPGFNPGTGYPGPTYGQNWWGGYFPGHNG